MLEQLSAFIQNPENTRELYLVSAGLMVVGFSVLVISGRLAPRDNSGDILTGNDHNVTTHKRVAGYDVKIEEAAESLRSGGVFLVLSVIAKLMGILGFLLAAWTFFNS